MQNIIKKEIRILVTSIKSTKFRKITWGQISKELIINGVSALIAIFVSSLLNKFFVVKSMKNLWGFAAKKDKMLISKNSYEWLSYFVMFIVGLLVFSFVEQIMENYMNERENEKSDSNLPQQ